MIDVYQHMQSKSLVTWGCQAMTQGPQEGGIGMLGSREDYRMWYSPRPHQQSNHSVSNSNGHGGRKRCGMIRRA